MQTIEYCNPLIKKELPEDGEWMNEPDKAQWRDVNTGLSCLIVRNHNGALCGYVGVTVGHPFFKKSYNEVDEFVTVHGGLTFDGECQQSEFGVCHKVEEGEDDDVWWLGFDCNHAYDLAPRMIKINLIMDIFREQKGLAPLNFGLLMEGDTYRNFAYVKEEVESLAAQISKHVYLLEAPKN